MKSTNQTIFQISRANALGLDLHHKSLSTHRTDRWISNVHMLQTMEWLKLLLFGS